MKRPVIFFIALIILSVFGLFQVKYRVQNLKKDLVEINRQIAQNKQEVHVLKAEWVYLNDPARIKKLSDKYLDNLQFASTPQVKNYAMLTNIYLAKNEQNIARNSVTPTLRPILSSARSIR
jgi:cell division protein FtsL